MGLRSWLRGDDLKTRLTAVPPAPAGTLSPGIAGTEPPWAIPAVGKSASQLKLGKSGRTSSPDNAAYTGAMAWLPRYQPIASLETLDLTRYAPADIIRMLSDASPEASMAAWNVLRLANTGFSISVRDKNDEKDDPDALKLARETLARINLYAGGIDTVVNSLNLSTFLQGAACAEAAPLPGLGGIEDLYPVDVNTIRFRLVNIGKDEQPDWRKVMLQLVPWQSSPRYLNPVQVFHVPMDPHVDDPYGRAPAQAAVGAILFFLDVLRDLRRALHMNAWGRMDIAVLHDVLEKNAPPSIGEDEDRLRDWMEDQLDKIQRAYADMEPDDSYIHWDSINIRSVDASGKMLDPRALLSSIEQLIIRGLKQLPTLMGGASQTRGAGQLGTLEYQIYSTGILAIQGVSSWILERALELDLRLHGKQARVHVLSNPIRTTDELKTQQALALKIQNYAREAQLGWIDQMEASMAVTGHEPVGDMPPPPAFLTADRPSPPPMPTNDQNPADGTSPNAGQPSVGETTGEGGDQAGAPQPAPSRSVLGMMAELSAIVHRNGHG